MAWITKNGKHIDTDWFDKERQIYANKKESDDKNLEEKYRYINPNFKEDAKQYDPFNNNCVKCALAFEANMRGEDTEALARDFKNPKDGDMTQQHIFARAVGKKGDIWNVGGSKRELAIKRIQDQMETFGDNSRAFLMLYYKNGKHMVNLLYNNGQVTLVDAQKGKHGDLKSMLKHYDTRKADIIRADDANISEEAKKWAYKRR